MANRLQGKRIAFLATDGVEQVELTRPWEATLGEGTTNHLISEHDGSIYAMNHDDKGDTFQVDRVVGDVAVGEYDVLVVPGGVRSPDRLRVDPDAVEFVRQFVGSGKTVASICHGPWMLVEADILRGGLTVASWPSLQTDIRNAGGRWVDEVVHVEQGIVTSRKPDDLPAFCDKLIEEATEPLHQRQIPVAAR